jgi:hypothetical protein
LPRLEVAHLNAAGDTADRTPRQVSPAHQEIISVAWSPDGQWLAYLVSPGGLIRAELHVMRPDGSDSRPLAGLDDRSTVLAGCWTALPNTYAFSLADGRGPDADVCLVDVLTGDVRTVASGGFLAVTSVSGDGRRLIARRGSRGRRHLVVVDIGDPAGGTTSPAPARRLLATDCPGEGTDLAEDGRFVPDGSAVYLRFVAGRERYALGVVPLDDREPYDVREIVARIVDGSRFLEFKAAYATDTICGHAMIEGHRVGLIGNNGPIQPNGSVKAAQWIQLCDQSGTPLVFLQNTTGYMVGRDAERAGAIKHGSKMIQAVANARVPKITIVVGGSYGAGNYGMCGRGFDPRFIFSWPSARVAVMGGAQIAKVMEIVNRAKLQRAGQSVNEDALKAMGAHLKAQVDKESTALFGTARLWDDGIIDPRDTRRILALCLSITAEAAARTLRPNTFGIARM